MRLLLDTHVFAWALLEPFRLRASAKTSITDPNNELFVSSISAWEIGCKVQKMHFSTLLPLIAQGASSFEKSLARLDATMLDVSLESLVLGAQLPMLHKDPFDRMLLGQALAGGFTFVTHDQDILRYPGVTFIKA